MATWSQVGQELEAIADRLPGPMSRRHQMTIYALRVAEPVWEGSDTTKRTDALLLALQEIRDALPVSEGVR